jgi:hypothetical protein
MELARQSQQVDRDFGQDGAALGQPRGRECPDGDPLPPEQEMVVVEAVLRLYREQEEVGARRGEAERDDDAAGAVDEIALGLMGGDFSKLAVQFSTQP